MSEQAKFDYVVKKSSFKQTKLLSDIHFQSSVNHINDYINRYGVKDSFDILLSIQSMEGMTPELIDKIDSRFKYFQIKSWQHSVSDDIKRKNDIAGENGELFESREDYCESCCIYAREELKQILTKMQQIEKGTENLDDFTKLVTIYDRLKRAMSYDYKTNETASLETRSLRGLLSGKTVCAGYATILQHILQRQGIVCKFVSGLTPGGGHAWNVVEINGKQYGLDLTWDSCTFHNGQRGMKSMKYFGRDVDAFNNSHRAMNNIGASDYGKLYDFEKDGYDVSTALGFSRLNHQAKFSQNCHILSRKDGSKFYIAETESRQIINPTNNKPVAVYRYIYVPYINNELDMSGAKVLYSGTSISTLRDNVDMHTSLVQNQDKRSENFNIAQSFINDVMSEENINKSLVNGSSFVGVSVWDKNSKTAIVKNYDDVQKMPIFDNQNFRVVGNFVVIKSQNNNLYKFTYNSINNNDGSMDVRTIYSETDLFTLPNNIAEKVLNSDKLDLITLRDGGYMGRVSQNGQIIQNPQLLKLSRESVGIKSK